MKYLSLITFLLLTLSCQTKEDHSLEAAVLDDAIEESISNNVDMLRRTHNQVSERGDRSDHVEIYERAKELIKLKKIVPLPYDANNQEKLWPKDSVLRYLDLVKKEVVDFELDSTKYFISDRVERPENLISRIKDLLKKEKLSWIDQRLVYLNILQLEGDLLNSLSAFIGSEGVFDFAIPYNRFPQQDTINTAQSYTFYLSPAIKQPLKTDLKFIPVTCTFNGELIPVKQENVEGLMKITFAPQLPGKYKFEGKFKVEYMEVEREIRLIYNNTIHVVE